MSDNAVTLYQNFDDPLDAITRLGEFFAKSGMFGCTKTEQGQVLAMACLAERKSPTSIVQTYHLIDGKLAKRSDAMLAGFRSLGGKVNWKRFDNEVALADWTFEGQTIEIGYSMDDARRAGIVRDKSGWTKDPGAQLRARAISKAVRMLAPEVISGFQTPEEIDDNQPSAPEKPLLPPRKEVEKPASVSKVETVAAPPPPVTPTPPVAEVMPTSEPLPQTKPATTPQSVTEAQVDAEGLLTKETIFALGHIFGDMGEEVEQFFLAKNWITADQTLKNLSKDRATLILKKPVEFMAKIKKGGVTK